MAARLMNVRRTLTILLWLAATLALQGKSAQPAAADLSPLGAQALVDRALSAELRTARDPNHPMRYLLHKASPRLNTTKELIETRDGVVARLLRVNGRALNEAEEQTEQKRLGALWGDPDRQRHRKQGQDEDTERALKVLRALPQAFVYQFEGVAKEPAGRVAKFTFSPNRNFSPQDLETQTLTAMTGEIWIDTATERVTRLQGRLERDVNFGLGILGRLDKGGWVVIEQADVGGQQWRVVRFKMAMSGRVLFKSKVFDTEEEESRFAPVPTGLSYRQGIEMLRVGPGGAGGHGR